MIVLPTLCQPWVGRNFSAFYGACAFPHQLSQCHVLIIFVDTTKGI